MKNEKFKSQFPRTSQNTRFLFGFVQKFYPFVYWNRSIQISSSQKYEHRLFYFAPKNLKMQKTGIYLGGDGENEGKKHKEGSNLPRAAKKTIFEGRQQKWPHVAA